MSIDRRSFIKSLISALLAFFLPKTRKRDDAPEATPEWSTAQGWTFAGAQAKQARNVYWVDWSLTESGDGSSPDRAFSTLKEAVDASVGNDVIFIGAPYPKIDDRITFSKEQIEIAAAASSILRSMPDAAKQKIQHSAFAQLYTG